MDTETAAALFEEQSIVMARTHMPSFPVIPYRWPFVLLENLVVE